MYLREINNKDENDLYQMYGEYIKNDDFEWADKFEGFRELEKIKNSKFEEWLDNIEKNKDETKLPPTYSPQNTYLAIENEKIVGAISIRWKLVPVLETFGGNIGYSIRPSERNKGYGELMLKTLLNNIIFENMDKVLITCKKENIPSKRVIEKNGGVLENEIYNEDDGYTYLRYWIKIVKEK